MGAATFRQAADVLASAGTPVTRLMRGEEIVYIRMEHVWVRAYIPYTDYRGAGICLVKIDNLIVKLIS